MDDLNSLVWASTAPKITVKSQSSSPVKPLSGGGQTAMLNPMLNARPSGSPTPSFSSTTSTSNQPSKAPKADAFDGLMGSFGASQRQSEAVSKMSLAEQQRIRASASPVNSVQPTRSSSPMFAPALVYQKPVQPINPDVSKPIASSPVKPAASPWDFDMLITKETSTVSPTKPSESTGPVIDDFFGQPSISSMTSVPAPVKPVQVESAPLDDPFGLFSDKPSTSRSTTPVVPAQFVNASVVVPVVTKFPVPVTEQQPNPSAQVGMDALVAKMVDIGFEASEAKDALTETNGNFGAAVDSILSSRTRITDTSSPSTGLATKIPGISTKNTEKAEKLLSQASVSAKSFFNRAKNMVADSTKIISSVIADHQKYGVRPSSAESLPDPESLRENHSDAFFVPEATAPVAVFVSPPKPTKKQRTTEKVSVSDQDRLQIEQFKDQGNVFFKQGQYGDAEIWYTKAINVIPSSYVGVVPVLNNRAAAQLKNGAYKDVVIDCSLVIKICTDEQEYDDVSAEQWQEYRDSLAKAYLRRATAYENLEKWSDSLSDYKQAVRISPNAKGAAEGLRRCQNAHAKRDEIVANSGPVQNSTPADFFDRIAVAPAKPTSALGDLAAMHTQKPTPDLMVQPSEAVKALRAQDRQNETDDVEKLRVKDDVDMRLLNWKKTKETNVRALISSLDTILWPELKADWKPVNLSELITPAQVKIRYMKAIGKLHPDKLSKMQLSVEQKMLANGIFGALNDAWDAFKVQNNM